MEYRSKYHMNTRTTPSLAATTVCTELENGIKIFVCPRRGTGTVFTQAVVRTGSIHEGQFLGCGLSHFLEHMVFSGTETHPGHTDIADRINALGGNLNASTGYNSTQYYMEVPPHAVNEALDMLYGMIARPLFPEERFIHEKDVILRESAMRNDNPYTQLHECLLKNALRTYPARVPIIGFEEKIRQVDRDRMRAYYELRYSPMRTAFVVTGDVEPEEVIRHLTEIASAWRLGRLDEPTIPAEPEQTEQRFEETFYNNPLAWIAFAYQTPNHTQKEQIGQDVFCRLLTGSDSARMIRELVTRQQLADEVVASRFAARDIALSTICAVTAPENAGRTIDQIREILRDLKERPVQKDELERIATGIERGFWDVFRSNRGLGRLISSRFVENLTLQGLDQYPELVRSVTCEDIMEIARKYHDLSRETLVLQMPEEFRKKQSSNTASAAQFTKPEAQKCANGVRTVTITDHSLPLVSFTLCLPGGNVYENKENSGISELLCAMLPCGTQQFDEEKFNALLDDNAIELSVENKTYFIKVSASCMAHQLPLFKDLLKSMLAQPLFSGEVFERENAILQRDLENELAEPATVAKMLTRAAVLKDHPLGMTQEDDIAALKKMDRDMVRDFYGRILSPTQAVASIGGALTPEEAENTLQEILGAIPWNTERFDAPLFTEPANNGVEMCSRKMDKAQSVVMYGFSMPCCKDYTMADALVLIASNGMASKLFKTVREERGLAYYTALSPVITDHASYATYLAGTKPGAEKEVLSLFEEERKLRIREGFSQEEFNAASAKIQFDIAERMQDAGKIAENAATDEYRGKGAGRLWEQLEEMKKLTIQDMNRAAKNMLDKPFRVMTVVSPENFSDFPAFQI